MGHQFSADQPYQRSILQHLRFFPHGHSWSPHRHVDDLSASPRVSWMPRWGKHFSCSCLNAALHSVESALDANFRLNLSLLSPLNPCFTPPEADGIPSRRAGSRQNASYVMHVNDSSLIGTSAMVDNSCALIWSKCSRSIDLKTGVEGGSGIWTWYLPLLIN